MRHVLIAGLLLVQVAVGTNILINPSFELWIDTLGVHLPLGWLTSEIIHPGSARKDSASHSGEWSVRLLGQDTAAFVSSAALVSPGKHYRFNGYARCPGVLGGSFVLQFLSLLGSPIGYPELIPVFYSGSAYRSYSRWVTAPDSASFISVSCATLAGAEVYVDDVTLDDTTVQSIEERTWGIARSKLIRKWVVMRASTTNKAVKAAYDCLGRRAHGRLVPGVYFLKP